MPTLTMTEKKQPTVRQVRKLKFAPRNGRKKQPSTDMIEVRRCCSCGNLQPLTDFDNSISVRLNGVEHTLTACATNGSCIYNAQQLAERLAFQEYDLAPKPSIKAITNIAIEPGHRKYIDAAIELERVMCIQNGLTHDFGKSFYLGMIAQAFLQEHLEHPEARELCERVLTPTRLAEFRAVLDADLACLSD